MKQNGAVGFFHQQVIRSRKPGPSRDYAVSKRRDKLVETLKEEIPIGPCDLIESRSVIAGSRVGTHSAKACKKWLFCPYCYMRTIYESTARVVDVTKPPFEWPEQPAVWVGSYSRVLPEDIWDQDKPQRIRRLTCDIAQQASAVASQQAVQHFLTSSRVVYRQWFISPESPVAFKVGWRMIGVCSFRGLRSKKTDHLQLVCRPTEPGDSAKVMADLWQLLNHPAKIFEFPRWLDFSEDATVMARAAEVFFAPTFRRFREVVETKKTPSKAKH